MKSKTSDFVKAYRESAQKERQKSRPEGRKRNTQGTGSGLYRRGEGFADSARHTRDFRPGGPFGTASDDTPKQLKKKARSK